MQNGDVIDKLRSEVSDQREKILLVKTKYTQKLEEKHEIEKLLRQCVNDLKNELWNAKSDAMSIRIEDGKSSLNKAKKLRKIEDILDREKKITLLYDKMFYLRGRKYMNNTPGFVMN